MKKLLAIALITSIWACKEEKKEPSIAERMKTYTISQMMDNESARALHAHKVVRPRTPFGGVGHNQKIPKPEPNLLLEPN